MTRTILAHREQAELLAGLAIEAAPYDPHPYIGIEEYPDMGVKDSQRLAAEVEAQGGPATVYNHFRSDAPGQHIYVARDKRDGTIHGVLGAYRNYNKMEPQKPSHYRGLIVHDLYASSKAPHGTGTTLMQAAADRARRDGADFSVMGAVDDAIPFYENMGGQSTPGYHSLDWDQSHRDTLAGGEPAPLGHGERGEKGHMFIPGGWSDPGTIQDAKEYFNSIGADYAYGSRREARDRISDSLSVAQLMHNALAHYDASSPQNREDGKSWYPAAADYAKWAGNSVGYDPVKSAAVVASLSPQRFWSKKQEPQNYPASGTDDYPGLENQGNNIGDSMRFFHHYTQHAKGDPNWLGRGAMGSNYDRVMRVHGAPADQASVEAAMRNPKTGEVPHKITNFYRNLSGDNNAVTIDSWMARGLMGKKGQLTDKASAERILGSPGSYEKMSEAVKRAAAARGILPAEMQATIWTKLNGDNYNDPDRSSINHPRELKYLPQPVIQGPGHRHPAQTVAVIQRLIDSVLKTSSGGPGPVPGYGSQPTQPSQPVQPAGSSVWGRDSVTSDTGATGAKGGGGGGGGGSGGGGTWDSSAPAAPVSIPGHGWGGGPDSAPSASGPATVTQEQAYAKSLLPQHGWGPNEMPALTTLWQHESDWDPTAHNDSGASGIAQFMPYTQPYYNQGGGTGDWKTQIQQGLQYIQDRYQTPSGAWDQYYNHPGGEGSY